MTDAETTARSEPVDDESDEDASQAQAQIIASLRAQVTDLFSQVTQLNGKLVASYDRVSNLEDQLHDTSSSLRKASVTISSLELERSHHLAALNTGLLVEKAHVTAELNRLMERATEEAAQRGQAESARHDIEKELDDLSASLFDQANTMVAEARLNQAKSERKVQDAEQALKIAEDAVKDMQVQMQTLQAEKEVAERGAQEAMFTMGKGKWVEREDARVGEVPRVRFMITHAPYAEFLAFVVHLRGLRVSQPTPPVISTLLNQPFMARLVAEDSEPTVRLDLAPSLNWLSRRSVLAAIHTGMLTVEPVPFSSLVQELIQHPQLTSASSLSCALCGALIARLSSTTPTSRTGSANGSSWFKYPRALGTSQNHSTGTPQSAECEPPGQVYIFRLATPSVPSTPPVLAPLHTSSASVSAVGAGAGASSRPSVNTLPPRMLQTQAQNSPYPLCTSNYCLTRLRSTCSLWAFVRVGIVDRIWEEEVFQLPKPPVHYDVREKHSSGTSSAGDRSPRSSAFPVSSEKPPVPPRRRRLWDMASALGERAVSWSKESGGGENNKEKEKERDVQKDSTRRLPPPPSHPAVPHPHDESPASGISQEPPPLPKRNVVRGGIAPETVPPSSTQHEAIAEETQVALVEANGHNDLGKADSTTPVDEITFTAPTPEVVSPFPITTSHPVAVAAESSIPPVQDPPPPSPRPPSPHAVPLPMTPTTPSPISRVTSPAPRSRSRLSSPPPLPPSSRPASPAVNPNRSHAGSPVPGTATVVRTGSPSPARGFRGKAPMPLLLSSSSRSASPGATGGPGAPPLPRRAPARRAVPLPPTSDPLKVAEEGTKEEGVVPAAAITAVVDPIPEADVGKVGGAEVSAERKSSDSEVGTGTDVVKGADELRDEPAPATGTDPEPPKDVVADEAHVVSGREDKEVNDTPVPVPVVPPRTSEADGRASPDTTSTKQSSSTEGEGFASDTTWEERTWKELTKLKEDMFWARIGGIRALQG